MLPLLSGISVLALDLLSKEWASSSGLVSVNDGVSFGMGSGSSPIWIAAITFAGLAVIGWWASQEWANWHWLQQLGVAILLGGGSANLIDRVYTGGVRDWLPLGVFSLHNNLADWAIALGVSLWLGRGVQQLVIKKL